MMESGLVLLFWVILFCALLGIALSTAVFVVAIVKAIRGRWRRDDER